MKILLVLVAITTSANAADFQLRLNRLDAFNDRMLPALLSDAGLENTTPQDAVLARGNTGGYDYQLTLRSIRIHLQSDGLSMAFEPGSILRVDTTMPKATLDARLYVDLISPHWYAPDLHGDYGIHATRVAGSGRLALELTDGKLHATRPDFSKIGVGRVDVQDTGLLGSILDLILAQLPICGPGCNSIDDYATRVVNEKLRAFLASDGFVKPVEQKVDSFLAELARARVEASDVGLTSELKMTAFQTTGAMAEASYDVAVASTLPEDPCAKEVEPAYEPAPMEHHFDPARLQGDLEASLSHSVSRRVLYQLARQGRFCSQSEGKLFRSPFVMTTRPHGQLDASPIPHGDRSLDAMVLPLRLNKYDIRVPLNLDVHSLPKAFPRIASKDLKAELAIEMGVASTDHGLVLALTNARIVSMTGRVTYLGIPLPLKKLQARLQTAITAQLERSIKEIPLLRDGAPLGPYMQLHLIPDADDMDLDFLSAGFHF